MADRSKGKIEIQVIRIDNDLYYNRKEFVNALKKLIIENNDLTISDLIKFLELVC